MKRIMLTNSSRYALIDAADYAAVMCHKWHLNIVESREYVSTHIRYEIPNGYKYRNMTLGRFIANESIKAISFRGLKVTYANGNRLDCRQSNLIVTNDLKIISLKSKKSKNNSTKTKNIFPYFDYSNKERKKILYGYRAMFMFNGIKYSCGPKAYYKTIEEAIFWLKAKKQEIIKPILKKQKLSIMDYQ